MRTIYAICTLAYLGKNVVVATDSDDEGILMNGLRRIRRGLRFIPQYEQRTRTRYQNHGEGAKTDLKREGQRQKGYYYPPSYKDAELLEGDVETEQVGTIETSAATGSQSNHQARYRDKTFGTAYVWNQGVLFGEDGWDGRSVGFSMPNIPATTEPKPSPTATATPTIQPPVPAPTTPPTSPLPENSPTSVPVTSPNPSTAPTGPPAEPPTREDREILIQSKCGMTGLERSRDILVELLKVSSAPDLVNPVTSQFAARDWIDNEDEAIVCPENVARIHQRYRLALLYFQMGGSQWTVCRAEDTSLTVVYDDLVIEEDEGCPGVPFLDKKNECEWYGLSCGDTYDSVQAEWLDQYFPLEVLDLQTNNLAGALSGEIFGLETLKVLQLSGNERITGSLPDDVGELGSLQELDLSGNAISGSLPPGIYGWSELTSIRLSSNALAGKLSNDIGSLSKLTSLELHSNVLSGTVPETGLIQLQQLNTLSLQENQFEGSLNALCEVLEDRRDELETYLSTIEADCDEVACSCCMCS